MEECHTFFLSSYYGTIPPPITSADTATMAPPFPVSYSFFTVRLLYASSSGRGGGAVIDLDQTTSKMWFASLLLFHELTTLRASVTCITDY
jgi:hypothetical protein